LATGASTRRAEGLSETTGNANGHRQKGIMTATEDANKALVIEAFDTLFNRGDHAGAEAPSAPSTPVHISAGLPESALANGQLAAFVKLHARRDDAEAGVR
jgi:hypothetical protein